MLDKEIIVHTSKFFRICLEEDQGKNIIKKFASD